MTAPRKPTVRLQGSFQPVQRAKSAPAAGQETVKLAIRLCEGVNEALRSLIRYRGDLSKMALQAFEDVDLANAPVVESGEAMVADTTISMPQMVRDRLRKIAASRNTSLNILVNTALAHWLAKKDLLRLA